MRLEITTQLEDLTACFPNEVIQCIFDVGANIGQSTEMFHKQFPNATIHCFEPTPESFSKLSETFGQSSNIKLNNIGLSNICGETSFHFSGTSTMNRESPNGGGNFIARLTTLDAYCTENKIEGIDYLKIDTEGNEIKVLDGATQILDRVKFVEAEASMNRHNKYHNSFATIFETLADRGFYLFGVYEQIREWSGGGVPIMRRSNPLFVNRSLIDPLPKGVITS